MEGVSESGDGLDNTLGSNSVAEDEFFFSSDHSALKENGEYVRLMKTLAILEFQRIKFAESMDILQDLSKQCEENSKTFLENIFSGGITLPSYRDYFLSDGKVDWTKLGLNKDDRGEFQPLENIFYPQTRNKIKKELPSGENSVSDASAEKLLVRGRQFDDSKPETFNQLWTDEEQARLEELLVEYPPERIENRRWAKIAKALGNRTPKQVCSRVQKYFLKLHKAGLSIPGRLPRSSSFKKSGKLKKNFHRRTTFFPKLCVETTTKTEESVKVDLKNYTDFSSNFSYESEDIDDDNEAAWIGDHKNGYKLVERWIKDGDEMKEINGIIVRGEGGNVIEIPDGYIFFHPLSSELNESSNTLETTEESERTENVDISDLINRIQIPQDDEVLSSNQESPLWLDDEKKYEILVKIKESRLCPKLSTYRHFNFMCFQCNKKPIVGQRWICKTCDINFCSECIIRMINGQPIRNHPMMHAIVSVGVLDEDGHDTDYFPDKFKSSNHLDPNFKTVK